MPKQVHNDVLDAAFAHIQDSARRVAVVSTTIPSTISSLSADFFAVSTCSTGNFTIGDGDASGRKCMIAQFTTLAVRSTGTAGHIIIISTGATAKILYATSCTTQVLGSTANNVTISSWKIEIADPT